MSIAELMLLGSTGARDFDELPGLPSAAAVGEAQTVGPPLGRVPPVDDEHCFVARHGGIKVVDDDADVEGLQARCGHLDEGCCQHGAENDEAVLAAHKRLGGALRVGHHAEDVAAFVADAGDVLQGAVGVGFRRNFAGGRCVAEERRGLRR